MSEAPPEVSVIIPTYNATKYIREALDSILTQTFQDFEIVLVNDGCPDTAALERVLEPYQSRIRYIKQANKGVAGARNTAIGAARAPLIFQMDPDDWLEPSCIEKEVRMMREHPEWDAVYCNSIQFADSPEAALLWGELVDRELMDFYPSLGPVSFCGVMESRTCPRNGGSITRREVLIRVGLYDEALRSAEDLDMWLRILKADPPGKVGYTREPLMHYRLRADSLSMDAGLQQALLDALEKAGRLLDLTDEERECLECRLAVNRFDVAVIQGRKAINERRWKAAIRSFEYCQALRPSKKTQVTLALLRVFPWVLPAGMSTWDWYLDRRRQRRDSQKQ